MQALEWGGGGGGGSKCGSENEKGDTSRYLLLEGYLVTERGKKELDKFEYNAGLTTIKTRPNFPCFQLNQGMRGKRALRISPMFRPI